MRVAARIAKVADGYAVIIGDREFQAYRVGEWGMGNGEIGPSLPTFSKQVEDAWIYKVESRSLSLEDRNEHATRNYALYCVLEAA